MSHRYQGSPIVATDKVSGDRVTLVVVPTTYRLLARNTHSPQYVSRLIEKLSTRQARSGTDPSLADT